MLENGNSSTETPVLEVKNLSKYFKMGRHGIVKAVDDVSFFVKEGETLGLVGESGCGKTTCGRTAAGLYPKTAGETLFRGKEISSMRGSEKKELRRKIQMIFQDPYNSLDPKMKVGRLITEGLRVHNMAGNAKEQMEKVKEILHQVGLHPDSVHRFANEFSGGQRQRIGIARALVTEPEFLLCDEPISALDVSIQAQIMNLLMKLQEEKGLTSLFIAHNLAAVKYISDRIAVMYLGKIVETGRTADVYEHPQHPYTKALMSAVAIPDPDIERMREKIILRGDNVEDIYGRGCRFADRCPYAEKRCREEMPQLTETDSGHFVACHILQK